MRLFTPGVNQAKRAIPRPERTLEGPLLPHQSCLCLHWDMKLRLERKRTSIRGVIGVAETRSA